MRIIAHRIFSPIIWFGKSFWNLLISLPRWFWHLPPIDKFTLMLAVLACLQAWSFIESERASVVPTSAHFATELVKGLHPLPIIIEMQNGGKSTATTKLLAMAITHGELPDEPSYAPIQSFTMTPILPGGVMKHTFKFDVGDTGWTKETLEGVKSGNIKLYLFGFVRYQDGFSLIPGKIFFGTNFLGTKETGFCFIYVPEESTFDTCQQAAYTYTK